MSDEAKWYVINTYSGYENKVASNLKKAVINRKMEDLITEIKIPTHIVTEIKDTNRREVERKMFPGYVFVKMILNDDSWHVVKNVRGCSGFLGTGNKPIPLDKNEFLKSAIEENKQVEINYSVGDSIKILSGPMQDFVGTVKNIDIENNVAKIMVSMFGRETPIDVNLNQIESVI